MSTSLVLTVIGPDQPGIVEAVAETVAAHGGNWEESRMARLAGQFAGILRVSAPAERVEALAAALGGLETRGLRVVVASSENGEGSTSRRLKLSLVGQDRPGIVRQISSTLARHGINVDELESSCSSAPMSGELLFHVDASLGLPGELSIDTVRADLERLANELMVDVSLDDASS